MLRSCLRAATHPHSPRRRSLLPAAAALAALRCWLARCRSQKRSRSYEHPSPGAEERALCELDDNCAHAQWRQQTRSGANRAQRSPGMTGPAVCGARQNRCRCANSAGWASAALAAQAAGRRPLGHATFGNCMRVPAPAQAAASPTDLLAPGLQRRHRVRRIGQHLPRHKGEQRRQLALAVLRGQQRRGLLGSAYGQRVSAPANCTVVVLLGDDAHAHVCWQAWRECCLLRACRCSVPAPAAS